MAKRVTTIPATRDRFTSAPVFAPAKKKVAGYARVSTDLEEQQTSYENQVEYYTAYIKSNPEWEFAGLYTDEGITATSTSHRDGFNEMIADALEGKINLIITKSVSRFARNTVDSLTTVRKLKEKGVEVYFEKENIWTLDSKGELLITIMSSLAQEESRSISENTTWGKRKAFADGKASVAFTHFLGYDAGFVINEEEAQTVRLIYKLFLSGLSLYQISKELKKRGMKTATGLDDWRVGAIKAILTNEKYKGDALLQKQYTMDFLTKKRKKNEGEIQQYYVEGHHEAIIDPATFDLVQVKMREREVEGRRYSGANVFASKIKCGDCGHWYGAVTWHSNDKYRRTVYRCNHKYKGGTKCSTPAVSEDEIKQYFLQALGKLAAEKAEVMENLRGLQRTVCSTDALAAEAEGLTQEVQALEIQLRRLIAENAHTAQNQDTYEKNYRRLYEPYSEKLERLDRLNADIRERETRCGLIDTFINGINAIGGEPDYFDEDVWGSLVDCMTVYSKEKVTVTFIGGLEVQV